ncbi:MAG: MATE family efflux transporter [Myxococcota bacterium]
MTHRRQPNLEWASSPRRAVLKMAGPIAVSMVSHAVIALVDTLCVSSLGASALAGVGLASVSFFTFAGFGFGFARGAKTLVAQAFGAGDALEVRLHAGASLVAGVALGVVVSVLVYAASYALPVLAASGGAGREALNYGRVIAFAGFPAMVYVSQREVRYGIGDSTSPMRAALLANAVNIGLDVLLVLHLDWGVAGAAWASVAAFTVQMLALFPRRDSMALPRARHLRELVAIGSPTGVQFVLEIGTFAVLAAILSTLPEREMAAHQVALQFMHFVFLPMVALGEACSSLAGQAWGADRLSLVHRVSRIALRFSLWHGAVWFVALGLGRYFIAGFFAEEGELLDAIAALLLLGGLFQVFDGLGITAAAILRGIGDVRYAAVVGVAAAWIFTPPLAYFLGVRMGYGAVGGWVGFCLQIAVQAALLHRRLWRQVGGFRLLPEVPRRNLGVKRPAA